MAGESMTVRFCDGDQVAAQRDSEAGARLRSQGIRRPRRALLTACDFVWTCSFS
jgi:hypothetical protein